MATSGEQVPIFVPRTGRWLNTTPVQSDDKPCTLEALEVKAHVSGLYAEVSEFLTIGNPNHRVISTDVEIAMPEGAVVCGYGLEIDGQIRDGVVVPKEQARVAFETERRRGVDPGLVEAVRGNLYKTRVYPVPATGNRRIRLDYVAPLSFDQDGQATLELPLPAEKVGKRDIRLEIDIPDCPRPAITGLREETLRNAVGVWVLEQSDEGVEAAEPVRIGVPSIPQTLVATSRDGNGDVWFVAAEGIPEMAGDGDVTPVSSVTVIWDASGSRATGSHAAEIDLVRGWCSDAKSVTLVTFSNAVHEVVPCDSADDIAARLEAVQYDGGTDFSVLADALAGVPGACDGAASGAICVLFTDGIDTLSEDGLPVPDGYSMLAVASGDVHDMECMRQACDGHAHTLASAPRDTDGLAAEFSRSASFRRVAVTGTGVADVCDAGIAGSGMRVALGRLTGQSATIRLGDGGKEILIDGTGARDGDTLAHAWAARRVALLSPQASDNADELLRIGRRFGVASPVTSLLVLETLDQWLRYDICPPKSWESMWQSWQNAKGGWMQTLSDEDLAVRHLAAVESQWRELLEWWEHDYSLDGLRRSVSSVAERARGIFSGRHARGVSQASGARAYEARMRMSVESEEAMFAPAEMDVFAPVGDDVFSGAFFDEDASPMAFADAPMSRSADYAEYGGPMGAGRDTGSIFASVSAAPDSATLDSATLGSASPVGPGNDPRPEATLSIRPWMPDAKYLDTLNEAKGAGHDAVVAAYFSMRHENVSTPSFFLDCAGWLMANGEEELGLRVLTNLAEIAVDDAPMLRVLAWRLREAGQLGTALVILKKVLALRGEDSQSHRDLALVLSELAREACSGKDPKAAAKYVEEAAEHYRTIVLTPWQRRAVAVALFAVEEYNVMRAWVESQKWPEKPELGPITENLEGVLDCDLRITLAWDADDTDIDIHVTEPNGTEAYYGNRRTISGGRVSEDITDGYGPELYEIRKAKRGTYAVRAHYFASHQQTVFGPATCTLTVYTDWGRPNQRQQIATTRLDDAHQMIPVGSVSYGAGGRPKGTTDEQGGPSDDVASERRLAEGMTEADVIVLLGEPDSKDDHPSQPVWTWHRPGRRVLNVHFIDGKVVRAVERTPWGDEMVIVQ